MSSAAPARLVKVLLPGTGGCVVVCTRGFVQVCAPAQKLIHQSCAEKDSGHGEECTEVPPFEGDCPGRAGCLQALSRGWFGTS